jgi:hypothetical protein
MKKRSMRDSTCMILLVAGVQLVHPRLIELFYSALGRGTLRLPSVHFPHPSERIPNSGTGPWCLHLKHTYLCSASY